MNIDYIMMVKTTINYNSSPRDEIAEYISNCIRETDIIKDNKYGVIIDAAQSSTESIVINIFKEMWAIQKIIIKLESSLKFSVNGDKIYLSVNTISNIINSTSSKYSTQIEDWKKSTYIYKQVIEDRKARLLEIGFTCT